VTHPDDASATAAALNALTGGRILGATVGDGGFPAVLVRMPNGTEFWIDIQRDPEGNGPGYANVERATPAGGVR